MDVGCGIHSTQLTPRRGILFSLPVLDFEDYLAPDFADVDREHLPLVKEALADYRA